MVSYVDDGCCDCATAGYPCLGTMCSVRYTEHFYCDYCGEEFELDELTEIGEDEHICHNCEKEYEDEDND